MRVASSQGSGQSRDVNVSDNRREESLSKTSSALRRLGVGALGAATISAGLVGFAGSALAATADINGLTINPPSATVSNAESPETCQLYTIQATEANSGTGGTITVVLQPTGGIDSQFCSGVDTPGGTDYSAAPGSHNLAGAPSGVGNGTQDSDNFALSATTNSVTIGVDAVRATSGTGQIQITAFPPNTAATGSTPGPNQPAAGSASATALENIVAAPNQNDVVTALHVASSNQTGTVGQSVPFVVNATAGATSAVQGAEVYYSVTSSQGNSTGADNTDCGATDQFGNVTCNVMVPPTTAVQSGPYTVTFKVPQDTSAATPVHVSNTVPKTNSGPTATATLNSAQPAAASSAVYVTCGGSSTERNENNDCFEPTTGRTETFTAHVTNPPTSGTGEGAAEPNVQVTFYFNCTPHATPTTADVANQGPQAPCGNVNGAASVGTEKATLAPATCLTGTDGSCSTTLTLNAAPNDGDWWQVGARILTGATGATPVYSEANANHANNSVNPTGAARQGGDGYVEFTNHFQPGPANSIAVSSASATPTVGQNDVITATVKDAFGNAVNNGTPVTFTVTGVGEFSNGSVQETEPAGPNGQALVTLQSSAAGVSHVTASLSTAGTTCTGTANASSGAAQGQCSATTDVTWQPSSGGNPGGGNPPPSGGKTKQHPSLSCTSPAKGVLKCTIQTNPAVSGLTVTMHRYTNGAPGNGYTMAGNHTSNGRGRVFLNAKPKPGNILHLIAYVHGNGSNAGNWTQHITITISK
jgi:hypothetical protein